MEPKKTIGILYICTGKYVVFWRDFYLSAEKNFIPNIEKHYFVFTDSSEIEFEQENNNIHRFYQSDLGWPDNTLQRFHIFLNKEHEINRVDYLIFCNANLLFQEIVTEQNFLPTEQDRLIAVQHPGFFNKNRDQFTYDTNPKSTAYIPKNEGKYYVAGGLNGGLTKDFLKAMQVMEKNIDQDLGYDIIAKWHDESHWNRYIIGRSDVKILDPSYLYPEDWNIPFSPRIIVRDKSKYGGHSFLRGERDNYGTIIIQRLKKIFKKL